MAPPWPPGSAGASTRTPGCDRRWACGARASLSSFGRTRQAMPVRKPGQRSVTECPRETLRELRLAATGGRAIDEYLVADGHGPAQHRADSTETCLRQPRRFGGQRRIHSTFDAEREIDCGEHGGVSRPDGGL